MALLYPYPYQNIKDSLVIPPGLLRHEVRIERGDPAQSSEMGMSITPPVWKKLFSSRAAILLASGTEVSQSGVLMSQVSHVVIMRWRDVRLYANDRVVFAGRSFTVSWVENVQERNRVFRLYCSEIDGGGA